VATLRDPVGTRPPRLPAGDADRKPAGMLLAHGIHALVTGTDDGRQAFHRIRSPRRQAARGQRGAAVDDANDTAAELMNPEVETVEADADADIVAKVAAPGSVCWRPA
jgi:hypothetical protein